MLVDPTYQRKKVLFMPACAGVSHAGRMLRVAQALKGKFDGTIEFAGNGKYGRLFPEAGFQFHEIAGGFSLKPARRLQDKKRWALLDLRAIRRELFEGLLKAIEGELELYDKLKPDLVVWDGRFTVPISAEVYGLPFVSVVNPALTPQCTIKRGIPRQSLIFIKYPSLLALTRLPARVNDSLATFLWNLESRFALRQMNKLRAAYKLDPYMGVNDPLESFAAVIFPDAEVMAPIATLGDNVHYVGPLIWQPEMELPSTVSKLHDIVYITMGSTGSPDVFRPLVSAFSRMADLEVVITTGGLIEPRELQPLPGNVHVYEFLPGGEVIKRARLVICHGAPATIAQALSQGLPVLGIPLKVPHELGIDRVVSLGAGMKLYPSEVTVDKVITVVRKLLRTQEYRDSAAQLAPHFSLEAGPSRAAAIILKEVSKTRPARGASGDEGYGQ